MPGARGERLKVRKVGWTVLIAYSIFGWFVLIADMLYWFFS